MPTLYHIQKKSEDWKIDENRANYNVNALPLRIHLFPTLCTV